MKTLCDTAFVAIFFLIAYAPATTNAGIPMPRYEALMKQQSQEGLGLYNSSDKVNIITSANFKEVVLNQNRTTLVEFYNSYCGHCKRFAPHYKDLAEQLYSWRDILLIGAIDCAAEENNDVCREYEVMAYPTLRYFGQSYINGPENYGRHIDTQNLDDIRTMLAQWIMAENTTASMTSWPNFAALGDNEANSIYNQLDTHKYIVLVREPENSTIGVETIIGLQRWPDAIVRRITDPLVANKFQIDGTRYQLAIINRRRSVVPYAPMTDTSQSYVATVVSFLRSQNVTERIDAARTTTPKNTALLLEEEAENSAIVAEVQRNKHLVYQADLEMALHGILFNEIPKVADIRGERLLALQRFLAVLQRYNPLGANGRALISQLYEYVMLHNQHLSGRDYEEKVTMLNKQLAPAFYTNHYVGCVASRAGLRGFTCSLWQLFHFMSVQAARSDKSQDPLEVLQAMHGYIKFFFGCTDCAEHFQIMALKRKIWSTPNKDEAVLWLWAAHNEVNQRLAGDSTEDPKFPKIQFPSQASCPLCYKQPITSAANLDISWDKDAVLQFMKNIHNPEYISHYGVEQEELQKIRQKRMISNVFSDMDMRMGMLLYGFCIVMMVAAFKLFAFKGYRKKPYCHDILGKV